MKSSPNRRQHLRPFLWVASLLAALCALASPAAFAAATAISQTPLIVANPDAAKANLLFILDDSGSMGFDFLPDHINGDGSPDPALCRSSGASNVNSGNFGNTCCYGGNNSAACWTGTAPFGTMRGQPPYLAAGFNGLAYDPTVIYRAPVKADGTYWASQTRTNTSTWTSVKNDAYNIQNTASIDLTTQYPDTEWCVDTGFTDCLRNDNYVLPGTVNGKAYTYYHATTASGNGTVATGAPDSPTTSNRTFGPHYYNIVAAEYCNATDLRVCQSSAGGSFTVPATVRWCNSDAAARASSPANNACQAVRNDVFIYARFPTKFFTAGTPAANEVRAKTTFTMSDSSCSIQVTGVTVNGMNLLGSATAASSAKNTIGQRIANGINARTDTGYTAATSNSGRTVTVTAPTGVNTTAKITFAFTPSACGFNVDIAQPQFGGYSATSAPTAGGYPGRFERVDIISGNTYPKASSRTDCAGNSCTYDEEMTNFANWWTYYHTRMQSMKSSAALAFGDVGNNRRVGYMSINNNTTKDFLNLDTFETTQRTNWFAKLTAAKPLNSTPLRSALSTAGKLYAGKYNSTTVNTVSVKDPVQYSCQRNFAILSTDGFWNETATPTKLDGTAIGDQDGSLARPMYDGNATGNTLADVAYYFYNTDLRTGTTGSAACTSGSGSGADVCGNDDPTITTQRMVTFTLGLGASGYMQFSKDYLKGGSKDYTAVLNGDAANPGNGVCSWQTSGACNWPDPVTNTLTTVDDLWHAAINGGGTYFSASNPKTLYDGLTNALLSLGGKNGAAAAATTSNPNVSAGDNKVFVSNFKSSEWTGEMRTYTLDLDDGSVGDTATWSAQSNLDSNTSRTIYMFSSGATNKLKAFTWATMTSGEQGNFTKSYITASGRALSQFCSAGAYCLSSNDQTAAAGAPLVNYLRGDRTNEGTLDDATKYFRERAHVLGDIVDSEAAFVSKSLVAYLDAGYTDFANTARSRQAMVYVAANDGMLHAFNADTGAEAWAYVPSAVLPNLYKLADKQYATQHQFMVDGTPFVQDINISGRWVSLLVGGMGAGGRAYYALDVTDPAAPKAMWEFTDNNLGLTLGQPEIGKLEDGTWVVIFGSGYNNTSPGDGIGRLFVVNAATGALIRTIATTAGDTTTPAGLAYVRAWVNDSTADNTIRRVYAGDNLGNVWRFDVNNNVGAAGYDAQRLATLRSATGVPQPVTSRPEMGLVGTIPMVFVGTGRYLGDPDLTDTSAQTIYGIKDRLDTSDFGDPRNTANKFVQQTIAVSSSGCPTGSSACKSGSTVRTNGTPQAVNLATNGGWYVDLPQSRERVNVDPQLVMGTLVVTSNVIDNGDVCKVGGSSWLNFFNYRTGAAVDSAKNVTSVSLGGAIATRAALYVLPNGKLIGLSRLSNGESQTNEIPTDERPGAARRVSWRDLLQQ